MAIKEKNQPASNQSNTSLERGLTKDGFLVNSQIDARLDKFMADNPEMTEHFTTLVKEHPDRAVCSFMLKSMFKHEKTAERNALQLPEVKEWVEQNPRLSPGSCF